MNNNDQLEKILEGRHITPVYQPIVSLRDGQTYGYEALSRISEKALEMDIEQMFRMADKLNKSWELETLCRTKALEKSINLDGEKKLLLNVNSNIIHDEKFREGFTKGRLDEYGLNSNNIIFEITERVAVMDRNAFLHSIHHYKNQDYGIAIDDVGAGFSGLNIIASVKPNLLKLDMNLVRDIDKDETKQLLCKAMVDFCKNAGILLIAEGIETKEELKTLIRLNVDLGQGYFLSYPLESFQDITPEKANMIINYYTKNQAWAYKHTFFPLAGYLSKPGYSFYPWEKAERVYEKLKQDGSITEFTVLENNIALGFMTKTAFLELLGGRYGFSLNSQKTLRQLIKNDFLRVDYHMPVNQVARLAMERPDEHLYSPIVVEKEGEYWGIVTIKDLLNACTKAEVDTAKHSNPLTGLPGNLLIEKEILSRVFGQAPFCITYFDIDNFKAYNDVYGFQNGDIMLALVADILKECALKNEFIGHIGGDDFIVISDYHEAEEYCQKVIQHFSTKVIDLYHNADLDNGYIISKNRHGVTESFPIATLSIAGISNKSITFHTIDDFSTEIASLKKKCKHQTGNYFEIL